MRRAPEASLADAQVLIGLPLAWVHLLNVRRLWRLYGPTSVFASPGFGWTLPLTTALLIGAWYGDSAAPQQHAPDAAIDGVGDEQAVHTDGIAAVKTVLN